MPDRRVENLGRHGARVPPLLVAVGAAGIARRREHEGRNADARVRGLLRREDLTHEHRSSVRPVRFRAEHRSPKDP